MYPLFRYINRRVLPDVARKLPTPGGFKKVIRDQYYSIGDFDSHSGVLRLTGLDNSVLYSAMVHDYSRFALSGYESYMLSINYGFSAPWSLIKLYYAAYYCANSLIRACGLSVSRLEGADVKCLKQVIDLFNIQDYSINRGEYLIEIEFDASRGVVINLEPIAAGSAAHEKFWIVFSGYLSSISDDAAQVGLPDANEAVSQIDDLIQALQSNGSDNSNWLSVVRNGVSYRHDYNLWIPASMKENSVKALHEMNRQNIEAIRFDIDPRERPIESFISSCQYICELSILVSESIAENGSRSGGFGSRWNRAKEMLNNMQGA